MCLTGRRADLHSSFLHATKQQPATNERTAEGTVTSSGTDSEMGVNTVSETKNADRKAPFAIIASLANAPLLSLPG